MRKIIILPTLLVSFTLLSCTHNTFTDGELTKSINFDKFTLETPVDWNRFDLQGIDSFVGGLTNKSDTLYFDYGVFSFASIDNIKETNETITFEIVTVNSYDSKIVKEKRIDENSIRLSFYTDKRDNENLNSIFCYDPKNEKLIREIFLTHKFK